MHQPIVELNGPDFGPMRRGFVYFLNSVILIFAGTTFVGITSTQLGIECMLKNS